MGGGAGLDGGDAIGAVAGEAGEGEEVGGVALGDALLAGDEAAGGDGGDGLHRREGIFEAGVAAVLEGVKVARWGAGAGARATAAGCARCSGGVGDEVGEVLRHSGPPHHVRA